MLCFECKQGGKYYVRDLEGNGTEKIKMWKTSGISVDIFVRKKSNSKIKLPALAKLAEAPKRI
jgi:hypothetical protein